MGKEKIREKLVAMGLSTYIGNDKNSNKSFNCLCKERFYKQGCTTRTIEIFIF